MSVQNKITTSSETIVTPPTIEVQRADILLIGEANKRPTSIEKQLSRISLSVVGNAEYYGEAPYSVQQLANTSIDDVERAKILKARNRNLAVAAEGLSDMLTTDEAAKAKVVVWNVSQNTTALLTLKENGDALTGNDFHLPAHGVGKAVECIRIVAKHAGDEANSFYFSLKEDIETGLIESLEMGYKGVATSSVTPYADPGISRPYIILLVFIYLLN